MFLPSLDFGYMITYLPTKLTHCLQFFVLNQKSIQISLLLNFIHRRTLILFTEEIKIVPSRKAALNVDKIQ